MSDHTNINPQPSFNRLPFIDWLRGFSIFLMIIYHMCYDLDLFGYIDTAFGHGYWKPFRYVIVIGFLSLVGVSLVLVHSKTFANGIRWQSMKKRSIQLLLACIAVTVSSYFIAPTKVTVFGILQLILVASWLALPFLNKPLTALVIGVIIFALGHTISHPFFDPIQWHWLGMYETKRKALDYAPIFPWLGMVLMGIPLSYWFLKNPTGKKLAATDLSQTRFLSAIRLNLFNQSLQWMGKHSLVIYLVHQPILFGVFYGIELLK